MILKYFYRCLLILSTLLASCSSGEPSCITPDGQNPDKTAFVKGADISWITQMESEGLEFYNSKGETRECTALMQELGMNAIRLRVWVNPEDGWNNKSDVVAKAMRAQRLGMRIMIDFHYSDVWADPGAQVTPKAWESFDLTQLKQAMADHTLDVLSTLKHYGVEVEWVQVGNETGSGMMHPLGKCEGGSPNSNYAELTTAGYDAVKSIYPEAIVIVHLQGGHDSNLYKYIFDYLKRNNAKYDMIGMSLYPVFDNQPITSWKTVAQQCISNINTVALAYGKPVMICEIGMLYSEAQETKTMLEYVISQSETATNGQCKGIFYWEPQAPAGYNKGYDKGAFDNSKPTIAMDAFK